MGFSRQEYWSGQPFLSPGDLPNPETEPRSPALQADSLPTEPPGKLLISFYGTHVKEALHWSWGAGCVLISVPATLLRREPSTPKSHRAILAPVTSPLGR